MDKIKEIIKKESAKLRRVETCDVSIPSGLKKCKSMVAEFFTVPIILSTLYQLKNSGRGLGVDHDGKYTIGTDPFWLKLIFGCERGAKILNNIFMTWASLKRKPRATSTS